MSGHGGGKKHLLPTLGHVILKKEVAKLKIKISLLN
jgi:hypothetical protein